MGSCHSAGVFQGGNGVKMSTRKVTYASVSSNCETEGRILVSSDLKIFCFDELKEATDNFSSHNFLGEGGFGSVFKGWIDENSLKATRPNTGMPIAVKMLKQQGRKGQQEWVTEIKYLGQLSHPNFVKLVGYCMEYGHKILVYEFMCNGTLDKHLARLDFTGTLYCNYNQPISWNHRLKIALGVARGLAFLHDEAQVIFRDLRASSILLDSNYNAKLSDFGSAKDVIDDRSHFTASISGTYGYKAPEFTKGGYISEKVDVYSMGVLLLELISGRAAVDECRPTGEEVLVDWAQPYLSGKRKCFQVFDVCLEGRYEVSGALKAAKLAIKCLSSVPSSRPHMKEVVQALELILSEMC